jgi:high-affinity Fe2+/Pb2+ permease
MAEAGAIDSARQEEFIEKVVEQISGTMTTLLGAVGDRLGLFKIWQSKVPRHQRSSHRGRS